jgi:hypothetical protein
MSREQENICNKEQMVTAGDRAERGAGPQLEISMAFIFIFPYVAIGIAVIENQRDGVLFCFVTCRFYMNLVST